MYRIVFFKIPFMLGGYRVPATPFGNKPIEQIRPSHEGLH